MNSKTLSKQSTQRQDSNAFKALTAAVGTKYKNMLTLTITNKNMHTCIQQITDETYRLVNCQEL